MKILTNTNNIIININEVITEQEDRWLVGEGNRAVGVFKEYKSQDIDGHITVDTITCHDVEEIPENVEPQKYCYTDNDGFYKNPDYKRYYSNEERIQALEDMVNELILGEEE